MHEFPKLIEEVSHHYQFELDHCLNSGIPWIKLKIEVPEFDQTVFDDAVNQSTNWREQWEFTNKQENIEIDYQIKKWNGQVLFGPSDWNAWMKLVSGDNKKNDEDRLCMIHRNNFDFNWRLEPNHPIRTFVESIFPNQKDINLVNFYVLPPGGYLFPHVDPCEAHSGLNKVYVALKWKEGNEFGFYKWGNAPIVERSAYLINNYRYAHWVLNRSNEPRVVLDIGANLYSIKDLIEESFKNQ
jgi:hypothetical protein